jgi:TolA-binding protein
MKVPPPAAAVIDRERASRPVLRRCAPAGLALAGGALVALLAGCGPVQGSGASSSALTRAEQRQTLTQGFAALEQRQYDQAMAKADAFLRASPAGPGSPEAMYLRGRSQEQKVTDPSARPSAEDVRMGLQSARLSYINALKLNPSPKVAAYTRASLANVAYFQDDYQTALQQWSAAYDQLDQPEIRAWALYRMGLCRQRLGQFDDADRTFAMVQQQFAGSEPARRSQSHQGARAFFVQLATFNTPTNADRAVSALKRQGVPVTRSRDAQNRSLIRVGPVRTYAEAKQLKRRFATDYPEAIIIP